MQRFDSRSAFTTKEDEDSSAAEGWQVYDDKGMNKSPGKGWNRASQYSKDNFKPRLMPNIGHRSSNSLEMMPYDKSKTSLGAGHTQHHSDNNLNAEREHNPHVHTTMNRSNSHAFLIMMMDGIGLCLITGCTLLQGYSEWVKLHRHHYQYNVTSLSFLICGRICQVIGLLLLIGYAFTMEKFADLEKAGMAMLTIGPILTAIASGMFDTGGLDPHALLNKRMVMTELVELVGILFLDLSFVDGANFAVFMVEVVGFITLMLAATLEFDFSPLVTQDTNGFLSNSVLSSYDAVIATFQATTFKWEMNRISDCLGLLLLMVVSYCQYRERAWEDAREKKEEPASVGSKGSMMV
jgi:hypothetical protein